MAEQERKLSMSQKNIQRIHLVYGIVLSALLAVTGILLIVSCVSIYQSGPRPFSPDSIAAAFHKISIPVYVTVGAVILGAILRLLLPTESKKMKAVMDKRDLLAKLECRLNGVAVEPATLDSINREVRLRTLLRPLAALLCVAAFVPAVVHVIKPESFTMATYNQDVINAFLWLLPGILVMIGAFTAVAYLEDASLQRQITLVKAAMAAAGGTRAATESTSAPRRGHAVLVVRLSLLAVGIAFVILGIFNGGMADVLSKAVNICTECIGLG